MEVVLWLAQRGPRTPGANLLPPRRALVGFKSLNSLRGWVVGNVTLWDDTPIVHLARIWGV